MALTSEASDYSSLKVNELKAILRRRKLPVTGKKPDLISRLKEDDCTNTNGSAFNNASGEVSSTTDTSVEATIFSNLQERLSQMRAAERAEREHITLSRRPLTTLQYFVYECTVLVAESTQRLMKSKVKVLMAVLLAVLLYFVYVLPGAHQQLVARSQKTVLWCVYWVGLGVLSSVGLGTGLHTFLLYLGPHIASVTLAAYECESVNFPEPPYPDSIVCPDESNPEGFIGLWTILSKVRLEAFMWGAGTALGELPPYFMARAARLSGEDQTDDDDLNEFEELLEEAKKNPTSLSSFDKMKLGVHQLIKRVGFWGILVCASIPNPLFDLAGITCGHFLVPFGTFFGATLIGKAVIKMHIQKLFVIFLFSEHHVEHLVSLIKYVPGYGATLQAPFKAWLQAQKQKLHRKPGTPVEDAGPNLLAWVFEKLVIAMIAYFVLSIVTSLAQNFHKRKCTQKHEELAKEQ